MWNDYAPGEKLLTKGEVAHLCRVEIRTPLTDGWLLGRLRVTGSRAAACCFEGEMCWWRLIDGRSATARVADDPARHPDAFFRLTTRRPRTRPMLCARR